MVTIAAAMDSHANRVNEGWFISGSTIKGGAPFSGHGLIKGKNKLLGKGWPVISATRRMCTRWQWNLFSSDWSIGAHRNRIDEKVSMQVIDTAAPVTFPQGTRTRSALTRRASEVAIPEVSKFGLCRIESDGLPGRRFAEEEAVADVLSDGLHHSGGTLFPTRTPRGCQLPGSPYLGSLTQGHFSGWPTVHQVRLLAFPVAFHLSFWLSGCQVAEVD